MRLDPRARVKHKGAFDAMKTHIASLYEGVEPLHSFEDAGGTVFDCIPVEQQPSLRGQSAAVADPPDLTPVLRGGEARMRPLVQEEAPENARRDRHGNAAWAPPGSIPFPRVRIEELARFENLDAYFRKHAGVTASTPGVLIEPSPETTPVEHRYARVDQQVANVGGHSAFTLYGPTVGKDQIFSLSQQWYYGGSGKELQTVEV